MKKLYIAYGSNMDEEQMAFRCPTATLVGTAIVEGYELSLIHISEPTRPY